MADWVEISPTCIGNVLPSGSGQSDTNHNQDVGGARDGIFLRRWVASRSHGIPPDYPAHPSDARNLWREERHLVSILILLHYMLVFEFVSTAEICLVLNFIYLYPLSLQDPGYLQAAEAECGG